jgi:hypothetical protein
MQRILQPEMLDGLPADHPAAVASRKDLRIINRLMNHVSFLNRSTRWIQDKAKKSPVRIVELGSGDGSLACRMLLRWGKVATGSRILFMDQSPCLEKNHAEPLDRLGWEVDNQVVNVFEWFEKDASEIDLCFASLFVHHFTFEEISRLFDQLKARTKAFVCLEPRRDWKGLLAAKALWCIRCDPVTLNDACISVRAGFLNQELSQIWMQNTETSWDMEERSAGLFSHLFSAKNLSDRSS